MHPFNQNYGPGRPMQPNPRMQQTPPGFRAPQVNANFPTNAARGGMPNFNRPYGAPSVQQGPQMGQALGPQMRPPPPAPSAPQPGPASFRPPVPGMRLPPPAPPPFGMRAPNRPPPPPPPPPPPWNSSLPPPPPPPPPWNSSPPPPPPPPPPPWNSSPPPPPPPPPPWNSSPPPPLNRPPPPPPPPSPWNAPPHSTPRMVPPPSGSSAAPSKPKPGPSSGAQPSYGSATSQPVSSRPPVVESGRSRAPGIGAPDDLAANLSPQLMLTQMDTSSDFVSLASLVLLRHLIDQTLKLQQAVTNQPITRNVLSPSSTEGPSPNGRNSPLGETGYERRNIRRPMFFQSSRPEDIYSVSSQTSDGSRGPYVRGYEPDGSDPSSFGSPFDEIDHEGASMTPPRRRPNRAYFEYADDYNEVGRKPLQQPNRVDFEGDDEASLHNELNRAGRRAYFEDNDELDPRGGILFRQREAGRRVYATERNRSPYAASRRPLQQPSHAYFEDAGSSNYNPRGRARRPLQQYYSVDGEEWELDSRFRPQNVKVQGEAGRRVYGPSASDSVDNFGMSSLYDEGDESEVQTSQAQSEVSLEEPPSTSRSASPYLYEPEAEPYLPDQRSLKFKVKDKSRWVLDPDDNRVYDFKNGDLVVRLSDDDELAEDDRVTRRPRSLSFSYRPFQPSLSEGIYNPPKQASRSRAGPSRSQPQSSRFR